MSDRYDLAVIGAGPGGYVAAARAAQLGLRTALVEKEPRMGGTCLLRGCIPTKALIQAAEVWQLCHRGARTFGVDVPEASFDWARIQKRKEMVITKGTKGIELLLKNAGVEVIRGHGRLRGGGRIAVVAADGTAREIAAEKIVLATGSTTAAIPHLEPDGERILTSDHLLEAASLPASMIVLGAGAVGVEFAAVLQAFGCKVTLVEMLPHILPLEDPDCAEEVHRYLKRKGMKIFAGTRAEGVEKTDGGVRAVLAGVESGEKVEVEAEQLLVAVGRRPVTADVGLESTRAEVDRRGYVGADAMMQTDEPGLYAIGDVVATPQLAHVASREALVAAGHAAGRPLPPIRYDRVPSCTYSNPEVASVGLTQAAAEGRGHAVAVGRFDFAALAKATILGEPHGFVKVVADAETGAVLGVHMVGPRVTELIAGPTGAVELEAGLERWSETIHPHPTLSEAVLEAVHAALGEPLHGA
jgi:dihydrolipoamide dehydrogenase